MSIRTRLLLFFTLFALGAIGLTAAVSAAIVRDRSTAYAIGAFTSARLQLGLSLRQRYRAFEATSELSTTLEVVRAVATYKDRADWGFATPEEDEARRRALHEDLVDSSWGWTGLSDRGFFAVADYKGRVAYASAGRDKWGGDARGLEPVAASYDAAHGFRGAGVVPVGDDALTASGIAPQGAFGCFVVFARGVAPTGNAGAAFVAGIAADELLGDVALVDSGTRLALVGPHGVCAGSLPDAVRDAGLNLIDDAAPAQVRAEGARWLVQRFPLRSLDDKTPIATVLVARNLDIGLALLDDVSVRLGLAAIPLLGIAVLVATQIAARLARPIMNLESAARRVAAGDLNVAVPVESGDEIGRLGIAFNQMTEGLRDRERIRQTFRRYMAPEIVDYLLSHPEAQALGGERRTLSVLFSDLVGFTTVAEDMEPEAVVAQLNEYFTEVSRRIVERGGTIDKYLGDAVMAFFGAPVHRADHPARACLAALDHLAALDTLRPKWAAAGQAALSVRVGVNTGEMIIGNIGGEEGRDYTVIGDAVNLASRLEGVNKEYGTRILITESTWLEAKDAVAWREIDVVRVKGKARGVRIYEVLAHVGGLSASRIDAAAFYESGLGHYRRRDFAGSIRAFEAALVADPTDGPSAVLLARCRAFEHTPPPPDWDGVFELTSK